MKAGFFLFICTLFLLPCVITAQDKSLIDSLYQVFHTEKDAIKKIELLYAIADEKDNADTPEEIFRYADSLEMLSKANHYQKGLAHAYDIRGSAYNMSSKYAMALPLFQNQLSIATTLKDLEEQGRALSNIGSAWANMTVNDSAVVYLLRSLDIKEKIGNKGDAAAILSNIAVIYGDEGAYDREIEMLHRVLQIRREMGEEKRSMYALNNLAVAYGISGNFEKSIAYADTGIAMALKYNNKFVAGVICGGMGHVLNEEKRFQESIQWCERSLHYLTAAKREGSMVYPLANLAGAYIGLRQYAKALEVNQRGYDIMKKLNLQEPIDPYHENFAKAYAGLGDYKNAYRWHQIYFERIDSITEKENLSKVANIEAKYGLEKKERQLTEQRAQLFQQRTWILSLLAGIAALLILVYLFYNRYRLKQQQMLNKAIIREQQLGLNAVIEAQEGERKRIAKDLHDGIAQELVALKLGLDGLQHKIMKITPTEAAELASLNTQLNESCTEVRNIAHVMMPPTLEQKGLVSSLELLLRNTLHNTPIQVDFEHFSLPDRLDEKTELGLYRITQELLNNTVKHAQASKILLQLYKTGSNLILRLEDNGKGFDFESAKQKGSMGLLNILSRVSTLEGAFFSEPSVPHGTISTIRIPV